MQREKEQLKLDLKRIQKNNFELYEGENINDYISLMLKYIGDTDPELRDDLIYSSFYEWICEKNYLSREQLIDILLILMDENHLFFNIGNCEDDTVFTRTFSVLALALIIFKHRKSPFLNYDLFVKVKDNLIRYYEEEKDLRGYTGKTGWAHGAAHGADCMDELVQCGESDEAVCLEVLKAVQKVLYNGRYSFCNEEDERITRVILRITKENYISDEDLSTWIAGLCECCSWEKDREQYITRVNTKNFIRCLYFKLMHYNNTLDIIETVFKAEEKLNHFLEVDRELLQH